MIVTLYFYASMILYFSVCTIITFVIKYILIVNEQNYKPGHVLDDHLSRSIVTNRLKRPT